MPDISFEPDSQSLDDFARRHGLELTRFAYLLSGDRARADDLAQDGLSALRGRFGDRLQLEHLLAHARRAVVHAVISQSHRRSGSELLTGADPDPGSGSGEELWQLLAGLPHRQRVVLVLRYHYGHSDGEIAETLGCRRGTVRGLASRALAELRTSGAVSLLTPSDDDGANRWVPSGDDLEGRLTELFGQRAAAVTQAGHVDLGSENDHRVVASPRSDRPGRLSKHGKHIALLTTAALVVVIAGAAAGVQTRRDGERPGANAAAGNLPPVAKPTATQTPPASKPTRTQTPPRVTKPTATPTLLLGKKPCKVVAPDSWRQAIAAGAIPVDRGSNEVLSYNSATGDYLVRQGNRLPLKGAPAHEDVKLVLFRGAVGRVIFSGGLGDVPEARMTGAISARWVTFIVTGQTSGNRAVMLYERASGKSITLDELTEQQQVLGNSNWSRPVIAAGKVYWLSGLADSTRLESWDLASGSRGRSVPAAFAGGLNSYGSGVLVGPRQGPGTPLSSDALAALQGAWNFDGMNTLSWLREEPFSTSWASLDISSGRVTYQSRLRFDGVPNVLGFPFIGLINGLPIGLLDLRTHSQVAFPAGLSLQAVVGSAAVFGTGRPAGWGWTGLSVVPLSALPPVRC